MNLCGGFTGVLDNELIIPIPDEEFNVSSRKKKSSSLHNRTAAYASNRQSTRSSRGSRTIALSQPSSSKSAKLNPVSRGDYEKSRSRHRGHPSPSFEMKPSSILLNKLESGFNLTWVNGENRTQAVNLSTNSDKSYIRIRMKSRNEEESENDGSKINQRDLRIKVRHIARVGSEKESSSEERRDDCISSQNKYFVIKMKHSVDQGNNKFIFLARSLGDRDTVVLAIRSLLDKGKHSLHSRTNRVQPTEYKIRSEDANVKALKALKISDQSREMVRANHPPHSNSLRLESRDDNCFDREEGCERVASDRSDPFFDPFVNKNYDQTHRSVRNKPYKNDAGNYKRALVKRDNIEAHTSRQQSSTTKVRYDKQTSQLQSRSPRIVERQRNNQSEKARTTAARNKITDPALYESLACNQALSIVEDGDIADLAGNCTNSATGMANLAVACTQQTTGPWCTDGVCTASLKDFANSMTGIFELKHNHKRNEMDAANGSQRVVAEEYISGLLSNNKEVSELLSVRDVWSAAAVKHATGKELKRLHNRARSSDGKARRMKNLRKKMSFKGADSDKVTSLQTISSFDDVARRSENAAKDSNNLMFYDSDPEDARERTQKRGPRVAAALLEEVSSESNAKRREALDIFDNSRFGLGRKWKRLGQEVLSDIIEATKNEKLTLLWHPTETDGNNNLPPVRVKLWVESGIYLADGTFLLPKLTWLPAYESNLDVRVLNVSVKSPGSIDLLDVCRVRECESVDRGMHPFARVDRSFIIQTQSGTYLFETQSNQERSRVVNGLKLVIARLASLLMLRDLRAVDEFFGGNAVPGEAPNWAKNEAPVQFPTS